jgi:tetratricopeptide (TPR) repeat protein
VNARVKLAFPTLNDPVRAVRIEAARRLAPVRADDLPAVQRTQLERGVTEYIDSQMAMAERPGAQVNLGNLYAARGEVSEAVALYWITTELNPAFVPAYVNYADLLRSTGEEAKAEQLLRVALKRIPTTGDIHHALGLSLVRQKRNHEALEALEQAAKLSPDNPRYVYVYAVALNSNGDADKAILVLQGAHNRFPFNTDILSALVAFHRDAGNPEAARTYTNKLRSLSP